MARPTKEREKELEAMRPIVREMASDGCTIQEIADFLKVDKNTVRNGRFKEDFFGETVELKQKLRRKQIEVALKGNVRMLEFLGKHILGQIEVKEIITSEKNLEDVSTEDLIDIVKKSQGKVTQIKK